MIVCVEIDGGAVEAGGLEFACERLDHPANLRERYLDMEEQAIGVLAVTEGLVGGESGGCQQCRAARGIEDVTMPMQSSE